ncbi:hypothetical protein BH09VER1_BH09VER1_29750 [soil metagenome]
MDLDITIPDNVASVLSTYELKDLTVADILAGVIDEHTEEMSPHVDFYMTHDRGTLTGDVELDAESDGPVIFDSTSNKGTLYIHFQEEAYYGCRDMDDFPDHDEEVSFSLDLKNRMISIHFPDPQERDTEEEF